MMTHLDILVLLVVVMLIFQRLKSLLGTRPTQEKQIRLSKESAEKLYNILKNETKRFESSLQDTPTQELTPLEDENLSDTEKALRKIPNFNKPQFLKNAEKAFRIITDAFNKGDVETLEMLVGKKIIKKFQEVIEQRRVDGIVAETDFIGFDKVDIIKASIAKNDTAEISVEFVSQQVNILRNKDNEVIEGDENYIQSITDIWTFERAIHSTAPNWILVSTKKS